MKNVFVGLVVLLLFGVVASGPAATLTVTNSADSGAGTLRQAILDANADASPDLVTIEFNIPGAGVQTIAPLTGLPIITRPVTIDGYTQPGASPNTLANTDNAVLRIELDGTNVTSDFGLRFNANDCTVRGLVINGFSAQVFLESSTNAVIEGNFLGTDVAGLDTNAMGSANGVRIDGGAGHRVGGLTPASRNIISGNSYVEVNVVTCTGLQILGNFVGVCADGSSFPPTGWAIYLTDCTQTQVGGTSVEARNVIAGHSTGCWIAGGQSNVIQGNFIGTDPTGTLRRTNSYYGLVLQESPNNLVGGPGAGEGNLFSGNGTGIYLEGASASNNIIAGNLIGPDVTGTNALGNSYYGVIIQGGPANTIGGLTPGARNVICGNDYAGVAISLPTARANVVQGNYIGVDLTGTNALSSTGIGIVVDSSASDSRIGGTAPGARNVIASNFHGIVIYSGSNHVIQGNFIGTDATGRRGFGNSVNGIYVGTEAPGTLIGGVSPGAGNLIATNGSDGIHVVSPGCVIQGNFIGTDVTGTNALGNGGTGVTINETAPFTQLGGTNAAARNVIAGYSGLGVYASSNAIQGNYFGIGADGHTIVGQPSFGITISPNTQGNLLGGDSPGAGNVVSGHWQAIRIAGSNHVVQGNFVGTDATGTLARDNSYLGLSVLGPNNLIGGLTPGARNIISASASALVVTGTAASGNTIQGNFIGTDVTGTNALGNYQGISVEHAAGNVIGGTTAAARNVISGQSGFGIAIGYEGASNNVVQGNYIGLAANGITPLPNSAGVRLVTGGNLIGGTAPGAGNWIAHHPAHGVSVLGDAATNNAILGNHIFANGTLGIDLGEDGGTVNDPGDADSSPNHFQNFPEMLSALYSNGVLHVSYRVDSAATNSAYPLTVEFFISDGGGEGQTLIHRATYSTPQATASIAFAPLVALTFANRIVATATDANGNSSEFSAEQGLAGWFTVTSADDSGPGSLRQAILDANADTSTEPVTIGFNLPGTGVQTLLPLSVLPVITRPVTIDGYTQPGASPNTLSIGSDAVLLIELNGTNFPGSIGLSLVASASNSVVRGLVINRCTYGIGLDASGTILEGNFIGTDATGTNAQPNDIGIAISGTGNRIGGLTSEARNVISGNTGGRGIWFTLGTSNLIVGNYVGLGADGSTRVPNAAGIYVSGPSTGNQIGGTTSNARNVISANGDGCYDDSIGGNVFSGNFIGTDASGTLARGNIGGITVLTMGVIGGTNVGAGNLLSGWNSTAVAIGSSNVFAGNFVGTDVTGRLGLGNEYDGVLVGGSGNVIGGTVPAARNVIAANRYGIFFFQPTANNNRVLGNYIGTDVDGTNGLGNAAGIVSLYAPLNVIGGPTAAEGNVISASTNGAIEFIEGATNNIVQGNFIGTDITGTALLPNGRGIGANTTGNLIGGTGMGEGNIIAGNGGIGVAVGETNNSVLGNRIFANGGLGIDLFGDGVNPNDAGDADTGPNHFQNFPEIASAALLDGDLTINYRVDSDVANSAYPLTVEFFLADSAASDEGRTMIHRHTYETPQTFTNITFTPAAPVSDGDPLVATATDANGNTSEFSPVATATSNRSPIVANPIPDQSGTNGSTFSYTFPADTFSDPDAGDTLSYAASGQPSGVTFDGPTRTFGGAPTVAGLFAVTVTATDDGTPPLSTNDVFTITVVRVPITVTNLADSGAGTLRQAIADALPGDTIDFAVTGTILLNNHVEITKSLTVAGPGATNLAIRGSYGRIFNITAGPTLISGLTLSFGWDLFEAQLGGGAILNTAHLTLSCCELIENESIYRGGAVMNGGNSATLIAERCTFSANSMPGGNGDGGGAIWSDNVLRITNCTFSGNYSVWNGGAVQTSGDAVIASSTIVRNRADNYLSGGGIFNNGGTLALQNSILSGNLMFYGFYQQEVGGTITSGDYNLIQYTNDLVVPGSHNVLGQDPILTPLRALGGPTRTCGLGNASPALDVADGATAPETDQRGVVRPQGVGFDIGAYEGALPPNNPPVVVNPIATLFAQYGDLVQFVLPINTFSDTDADQSLSYSLMDPSFTFFFDPVTRTISGNVYQIGTNTIDVVATDNGAPVLSVSNSFEVVVSKRPITVSADDARQPQGVVAPLSFKYYNLVGLASEIDNPPTLTTAATSSSPPGNYPITISGGADDKYEFVGWTNGTLTVLDFAVNYNIVRRFGFTAYMGSGPEAPMVEASDGVLYGVAGIGVFRISQDGTGYQLLLHFGSVSNNAYSSQGLAVGNDGTLYGTTFNGGAAGFGSVFRVNRDGTGYQLLRSFGGGASDSDSPTVILQATNGVLYGLTRGGFGGGKATVFRMDPDGSNYAILHEFDAINDVRPACLFQSSDGKLYGTTESFGTSEVVFRLELDGSGFTSIYTFTYGNRPTLCEASDGVFYGVNTFGNVVFKLNRDGSGYTELYNFTAPGDGYYPWDTVIEGPDGALYGTTRYGGTDFSGNIFKLNKDGSGYAILRQNQFGNGPYSLGIRLTSGSGGQVHGPSSLGLFKLNTNGSDFTMTWTFKSSGGDGYGPGSSGSLGSGANGLIEASDGRLYGVTSSGGTNGGGTVFGMNKNGSGYELLHHFSGANGQGYSPIAPLIEGQDGALYGSTPSDVTNYAGALFRVNKDGSDFSVLHAFTGYPTDGATPAGALAQDSDGILYGVTVGGGTNGGGTVFSLNTNGTAFTILAHFGYPGGTSPQSLSLGSDGKLRVVASWGGANSGGQLLRMEKDGTVQTVLHDFLGGSDGASPYGSLIETSDGMLYGVTGSGGTNGAGTVFKLSKDGSNYEVLRHLGAGPYDGALPFGGVRQGADGALYGMCINGGAYGVGTVFRITTNGLDYCVVHHFGAAYNDGAQPSSTLLLASDGVLYGTTSTGFGTAGFGTVFRLAVAGNQPPIVSVLIPDQVAIYGSAYGYAFAVGTFTDPDASQTLSYSASGLPPGVTFDDATRTFSGTPTSAGTNAVILTATDNGVPPLSTNDTFNIVVDKAQLTVSANNTNRPYGEADPTFSGTLVGVTNSDSITATFATTATLSSAPGDYPITPALQDPNARLGNYIVTTNLGVLTINGVTMEFGAAAGSLTYCWPTTAAAFLLEYTDDLTPPITWQSVTSGITTNTPNICLTVAPEAAVPSRFYRLRLP